MQTIKLTTLVGIIALTSCPSRGSHSLKDAEPFSSINISGGSQSTSLTLKENTEQLIVFSDAEFSIGGSSYILTDLPSDKKHLLPNDLGYEALSQAKSVQEVEDTLLQLFKREDVSGFILYGASIGTATMLNSLAKLISQPNLLNLKKVKALILENPIASMNNTIVKTADTRTSLTTIPGVRYVLPSLVSLLAFGMYDPCGIHPYLIRDLGLELQIPIILTHSSLHTQISFQDTQALHQKFLKNGYENIYILSLPGKGSIYLHPDFHLTELKAVRHILQKHDVYYSNVTKKDQVDLTPYQHNQDWSLKPYNDLVLFEKKQQYTAKILLNVFYEACFYVIFQVATTSISKGG